MTKSIIKSLLSILIASCLLINCFALEQSQLKAASILLCEQNTGAVLYEYNADEKLNPASITKIMTLLLVCEALESGKIKLDDNVTASTHASQMGGSQIWLKEGETMTVDMLLRATAVSSANDASVALAEHVSGSEEVFVSEMNRKAEELGMSNTHFVNACGLDEENHYSTARDIAIMSRELLKHDMIKKYTTVWMDSLRDGATQLVNTNKLIRYYKGATGLKTGTTSMAGSCLSASATRNGLSLIAVTMKSNTSNDRFDTAKALLDYGFSNYEYVKIPSFDDKLIDIPVKKGVLDFCELDYTLQNQILMPKGQGKDLTVTVNLPEEVTAPIKKGEKIGNVTIKFKDNLIKDIEIFSKYDIIELGIFSSFIKIIKSVF